MPTPALLRALDDARSAFLDALEAFPAEDRSRPPAPDAWSALQIAEHLYLVEASTARLLAKWIERGRPPTIEAPDPAHLDALERAMDGKRKFRVPDGAGPIAPTGERDYAGLREAWLGVAGEWHRLDGALPEDWKAQALMRHPLAGSLDWEGTLRFLTVHLRHHRAQLDRTLAALA